jgi:hypothetical protein
MMTQEQAWYIYAILPPGATVPEASPILPGAGLEILPCCDLAVLASRVPRALFDSTDPDRRTDDPDWMQLRLVAHHAVNAACVAGSACLPLAFGVLFSSLAALEDWLAPLAGASRRALGRVAGQSEWALELREDAPTHEAWLDAADAGLRELRQAIASAGPGIAFLKTRQLETARRAARDRHLGDVAADIARRLGATGLYVGGGAPSWSVLAPRSPAVPPPLEQALSPLAACVLPAGLEIRLHGPWPAYGYARAVLAGEAAHG